MPINKKVMEIKKAMSETGMAKKKKVKKKKKLDQANMMGNAIMQKMYQNKMK